MSGIGETDFLDEVWYARRFEVPASWLDRRIILHFQAVDHDATVWVNGKLAGKHRGGFTPFDLDITALLAIEGENALAVRAIDSRSGAQARGKQSTRRENFAAFYSRVTGIWQDVWLEPIAASHLRRPRITPDVANSRFRIELPLTRPIAGATVVVTLANAGDTIASATAVVGTDLCPTVDLDIPESDRRLWQPSDPHLYELTFELELDGQVLDRVDSYAGLRSVAIDGKRVLINGQVVFQRLVLDQGWYADGLMTAPSDQALIDDIRLSMEAGFNGARLHQKVFEERFLYHADRMGYLVWGEFGDWGANLNRKLGQQEPTASFITQWLEALERDYSHPSIIGWCPLNETYEVIQDRPVSLDDVTLGMYLATKAADRSRPVLDASGYSHRVVGGDIYDSHNYQQDPAQFATDMAGLDEGKPYVNAAPDGATWSIPYDGQPYFCSEFAGIWWAEGATPDERSWGYGAAPTSLNEWYSRFEGLVDVLFDNTNMFGYCFTQLTDVFQEQNGIFTFDRRPKFDLDRIRAIQQRVAAIEQAALIGGASTTL